MPARKIPFLRKARNKQVTRLLSQSFISRTSEDNRHFSNLALKASKTAKGKKKSSLRRIAIARRYASMLQGKKP